HGAETDETEGHERKLRASKSGQTRGHRRARVATARLERDGVPVPQVGALEHSVEHELLTAHAERRELGAGALRLTQGGSLRATHEHEHGAIGVDEGPAR